MKDERCEREKFTCKSFFLHPPAKSVAMFPVFLRVRLNILAMVTLTCLLLPFFKSMEMLTTGPITQEKKNRIQS